MSMKRAMVMVAVAVAAMSAGCKDGRQEARITELERQAAATERRWNDLSEGLLRISTNLEMNGKRLSDAIAKRDQEIDVRISIMAGDVAVQADQIARLSSMMTNKGALTHR